MFIELTDHLRCPADHPESYLVLLPEEMQGRQVERGSLGCPVCGRVVPIERGVARFAVEELSLGTSALQADAIAALLGLSGPGGFVALVGSVGRVAGKLAPLLEGVGIVLVNPPDGARRAGAAGVLHAARMPLKSGSMRGVVVGEDLARGGWAHAAALATLPGLRIVVEGYAAALPEGVELLAESPGCWVGRVSR